MSPTMHVSYGACTDRGLIRSGNEDSYLATPPVFVVADGMGGHAKGEEASRVAVDAFARLAQQQWASSDDIIDCVAAAADAVQAVPSDGRRPGTTLTGVAMSLQAGHPCWLVFNIGDSRTYLVRGGELRQISVDHSASNSADKHSTNVITRALGAGLKGPIQADQWIIPAQLDDRMLLCTDGLTGEISDELILATLSSGQEPQLQGRDLVNSALRNGGRDNVTTVVLHCDALEGEAENVSLDDNTESNLDDANDETVPEPYEEVVVDGF